MYRSECVVAILESRTELCDTRCSLVICVMIRGDLGADIGTMQAAATSKYCHILHANGPTLIEFANTFSEVTPRAFNLSLFKEFEALCAHSI